MARKLTSTSCSGISIVVAALCTPAAANLVFASINQLMFYFTRVNSQQGGVLLDSPVIADFASVHFATTPFLQL